MLIRSLLTLFFLLETLVGTFAANSTLSALPAASALGGTELMYCVQSGGDTKCTPAQLSTYIQSLISGSCTISANVITCTDAGLSTSDITTNNVSTSKHGFAPKLPNDATKYLDGTGAYSIPAGSASTFALPPYKTANWYTPTFVGSISTGSAVTLNTIRMHLGYVSAKVTIDTLGVRIGTAAASGNVQLAIYATDTNNRPTGSALVSTASISTTTATSVNAAASLQLGPGWYWFASNTDNSTAAYASVTAAQTTAAGLVGSTTQGNDLGNGSAIAGLSFAQTFGTWPSLTGQTFTDVTAATMPVIQFKVNSIP